MTERELTLRRKIMVAFAQTGAGPALDDEERPVLQALAANHVVALDEAGEILMAHPFAAHHDGARVDAGGRTWWGNCAWAAYGDRLDPDWSPRTIAQSQAILDRHGLTGPFWSLSGSRAT